jgi:hypothetical protein
MVWTEKTFLIPYVPCLWIVSPLLSFSFTLWSCILCVTFWLFWGILSFCGPQLYCGNPFVLSSCDCALAQLFCCSVMNLTVIKISLKFYDRYSVYTWASHCGKHLIFISISYATWLWILVWLWVIIFYGRMLRRMMQRIGFIMREIQQPV